MMPRQLNKQNTGIAIHQFHVESEERLSGFAQTSPTMITARSTETVSSHLLDEKSVRRWPGSGQAHKPILILILTLIQIHHFNPT
jgi:hypothetical protein